MRHSFLRPWPRAWLGHRAHHRLLVLFFAAAAAHCAPSTALGPSQPSGDTATLPAVHALPAGGEGSTLLAAKDTLQLACGPEAPPARPRLQLVVPPGSRQRGQTLQAFLTAWVQSTAFAEQFGEYGIEGADVALPIESNYVWPQAATDAAPAPGATASSDVERALTAAFGTGGGNALGAAPAVAIVLVPVGTEVTLDGPAGTAEACGAGSFAWHSTAFLDGNQRLPYVALPYCRALSGLSDDETASLALSFALGGALTNPSEGGFSGVAAAQGAWQQQTGEAEVASLCQRALYGSRAQLARPAGVPLPVYRSWSNKRALAGTSPCAPAIAGELYSMALPGGLTPVRSSSEASAGSVQGVWLAPGATVGVPIKLLAEGTGSEPISVAAAEVGSSDLTMAWSHNSGQRGDLLLLSIALAAEPGRSEYLVRLASTVGVSTFSQYLLLAVGDAP